MDAIIELFKRDIDRSLLRENRKLTVEQRLVNLMRFQEFVEEVRRAGRAARPAR